MDNIMGMCVIITDQQRDLVWVVGNTSGISTKYLPKSWWRITKLPDDQALINTDNNTISMTPRGYQAYKQIIEHRERYQGVLDRRDRALSRMAERDSEYL